MLKRKRPRLFDCLSIVVCLGLAVTLLTLCAACRRPDSRDAFPAGSESRAAASAGDRETDDLKATDGPTVPEDRQVSVSAAAAVQTAPVMDAGIQSKADGAAGPESAGAAETGPAAPIATVEAIAPPQAASLFGRKLLIWKDQIYKARDGLSLKFDLYVPDGGGEHPLALFMHGGSWVAGSRDDVLYEVGGRPFETFVDNGWAVATISYTLLDETVHFPDNVVDVIDAVSFFREHGQSYFVDGSAIGLWGSSAGGHLALLAAYAGEHFAPLAADGGARFLAAPLRFAAGINPPTDLWRPFAEHPADGVSEHLVWSSFVFFGHEAGTGDETMLKQLSPLYTYSETAPPTLLLHGTNDSVVDVSQSTDLVAAIEAQSGSVTYLEFAGAGHGLFPLSGDDLGRVEAAFLDLIAAPR